MPNIGKRSALSSHNNYTSIDSHSSSSSDDDEAVPPSTSSSPLHAYSLYRQYSKRLFKDSTSNLKDLESTYTSLNHPDRILSPSSAAVAAAALAHPHEHLTDPSFSAEIYEDSNNNVSPKYIELLKIEFFILGFVIGAAIQMFCVSIILMFVSYSQHSGPLIELSHEYYPVFRCMFFVSFFFTLYGGNLFLWRRAKIEYRSVLGVGSSHTYQYVLRGASTSALIMFTCFMLYVLTITGGLESLNVERDKIKHLWPAMAFLVPLFAFFCPYDSITSFYFGNVKRAYEQRMGLVSDVIAVLLSPFSKVTFLRSFIADIFCSMPRVFTDLQYTLCIYTTGTFWDVKNEWLVNNTMHAYQTCGSGSFVYVWLLDLLSFLPYHIRLMQSFRMWIDTGETKHIFNALKYTLSLSVTGLALLHGLFPSQTYLSPLWFLVSTVATAYSFYWDIVMDWGLGNMNCSYVLLREELYFKPQTYYLAIVLDLLMRLGWALYISPAQVYVQQHIILVLGCIELLRRTMWAVFRVEWEWIKIQKKNTVDTVGILNLKQPVSKSTRVEQQSYQNGDEEDGDGSDDILFYENDIDDPPNSMIGTKEK